MIPVGRKKKAPGNRLALEAELPECALETLSAMVDAMPLVTRETWHRHEGLARPFEVIAVAACARRLAEQTGRGYAVMLGPAAMRCGISPDTFRRWLERYRPQP